jgi:phosphatidylglycerophosphate synthase
MTAITADSKPFRNATRILSSVLSPLEKRTLLFLAPRLPAWVNSDHLTGLGLTAMLGAGISFWIAGSWPGALLLIPVCLAVNWFGDSLDGTLARVRRQERPRYGYYVDHVVDVLGASFLLGGMALSGFMNPMVAIGILAAYGAMSLEIALAAHALGEFRLTYAGMGPTELRILLAIGALSLFKYSHVVMFGRTMRLFDVGGGAAIVGIVAIFLITAARHTRTLYRLERRS